MQFYHEVHSSWREVINANKSTLIKLQLIPLSSHDLKMADSFYFHRTKVSRSPKNSSNWEDGTYDRDEDSSIGYFVFGSFVTIYGIFKKSFWINSLL